MKHFFAAATLLLGMLCHFESFGQTNGAQTVLFKGIVGSNDYDGNEIKMYGSDHAGAKEPEQTAVIKNGIFQIEVPFRGPGKYRFQNGYEMKVSGGYAPFTILVEKPGVVTITANIASLSRSKVSGSVPQDVSQELDRLQQKKQQERRPELVRKYGAALIDDPEKHMDDPKIRAYAAEHEANADKDFEECLFVLARKYPNSFAIADMATQLSVEKQEKIYHILSPENKKNRYAQKLEKNISVARLTATGKKVSDFSLPTPTGETQNLKALLAGKKCILIDFWASWCVPCRQEFGHLRELYDKYKSKGFEVWGISTDQSKGSWLGALKQENLSWPQAWDGGTAKDKQIAGNLFYVPFLPTTYLLNENGEIIANNLRGEELDKKIAELLSKN